MKYSETERNVAYVPSADLEETKLSDFMVKGKF